MEEVRSLGRPADDREFGVDVDALAAPACVVAIAADAEPTIVATNAPFQRWAAATLGVTRISLKGVFGGVDTPPIAAAARRALAQGLGLTLRLEGGGTPATVHVAPLVRGARRGVLVTVVEAAAVLDAAALDAPLAVLDLAVDGRILAANRAAGALFEPAGRGLVGAAWTDLLAPGAELGGTRAEPIDGAVVDLLVGSERVRRMRVASMTLAAGRRIALSDVTETAGGDGDAQRERARLVDAVASMGDGFALYDADDRLVLVNDRLKEMMPRIADALRPGTSYEEVLRTALARDAVTLPEVDAEAWLRVQLARHEGAPGEYEVTTRVGRHLLIDSRRTAEGGVIETVRDITARWQRERSFARLASHDDLTGLPNRVAFFAALRQRLEAAARDGATLAVGFIDVDGLKRINDGEGHAVGDAVLKSVAERLARTARFDDVIARLSGDEFALVSAPTAGPLELDGLAERLIDAACRPVRTNGAAVTVSISLGLVRYPADAATADALIAAADRAMYAAKSAGGGTWRTAGD